MLEESAKLPYASGAKSEDYKTACDFVGAKYGEEWTREQEEKFTEEFVNYLAKGKAPSNKLKRVFNNLKNLFVNIYKKIRGNVPVSKEMAEVFDRLLATEKEIEWNKLYFFVINTYVRSWGLWGGKKRRAMLS